MKSYYSILNKANAKGPTFKVLKQQLLTHHHPQIKQLSFVFFFSLAYYLFRIRTDFYLDDAVIQADIWKKLTSQKIYQGGPATVPSVTVNRLLPSTRGLMHGPESPASPYLARTMLRSETSQLEVSEMGAQEARTHFFWSPGLGLVATGSDFETKIVT